MPTIQVDQRVLDALARNGKFGDTYDDLLCDLLSLPRTPRWAPRASGKLAGLLAAGLLQDGQHIVWHRGNLGLTFTAVITGDGNMPIPDGRTFISPDACSSALAGHPCKG